MSPASVSLTCWKPNFAQASRITSQHSAGVLAAVSAVWNLRRSNCAATVRWNSPPKSSRPAKVKFCVAQILDTQQDEHAEQHDQCAREAVNYKLQERKRSRQSAQPVQHQHHPPRRQPAIQELMVNVPAIGAQRSAAVSENA